MRSKDDGSQRNLNNTLSRKTYPTPHNHHLLLLLLINRRSQNMATHGKCTPRGYLGISATNKGEKPIRKKRGGTQPSGHGWRERGIKNPKKRGEAVEKKPLWTTETSNGPTCYKNDTSCGRQYDYKMRRSRSNKKRSSNNGLQSRSAQPLSRY